MAGVSLQISGTPNVLIGTPVNITLLINDVLTLDVDQNAVGIITQLSDLPGGEPSAPVVIAAQDLTFGPYGTVKRFELNLTAGNCRWSIARFDPNSQQTPADVAAAAASAASIATAQVAQKGTVTLNGATPVTVTNANLASGDIVVFSLHTVGGTVGAYPSIKTVTFGTGFTVAGTASDTSTYDYKIMKSATT